MKFRLATAGKIAQNEKSLRQIAGAFPPEMRDRVRELVKAKDSGQLIFEQFAAEYKETLSRADADRGERTAALRRQLSNTTARIDRIVEAIAEGTASRSLREKLSDLEADKDRLARELTASEAKREPVELHPNLPELYRRRVADLENALKRAPAERAAAREILRSFIEGVVVYPGDRRGETTIKLEGSIAAVLDFARFRSSEQAPNGSERSPNRSVVLMVPRGGIEPPTP